MAFQIKPGESVAKCVRRLARSQVEKALEGLNGRDRGDTEEVVHDARKRFKRVRAVVRLASEGLGRKAADRENERFRDAGRPLSEVRDAGVLVQTLDALVERYGDQGRPEEIGAAREALVRRKRDVCRRVIDEEDALSCVARILEEARGDIRRWEIDGGGWDALEGGLKRLYKGGFRAFRDASEALDDEALHEWRKRVKDLWYVLDILKPLRPGYVGGLGTQAHALADRLGDDHDLAVLGQVLSGTADEEGVCDPDVAEALRPLIDRRRAELQRDAFTLGPIVYGARPKVFTGRLGAYWRAWRAEVEAEQFGT